jgi:deoxyguanosine kinase
MAGKDYRYIVVEGPIGVGKTSLVKRLSKELKARLLLEKVEDNPFLKEFYKDPRRYAFQAQIFFLLSRYGQLQELRQRDLFEESVLSDYFLPKDRLFAMVNLEPSELALYDRLFEVLDPEIPVPDLVIYLQAGSDVLMDRIRRRGIEFESPITAEYLEAVNRAYNKYFFTYSDSPLLVIQTSEIDFVNRRDDLDDLIRQIRQMKKGTQYYVPRR